MLYKRFALLGGLLISAGLIAATSHNDHVSAKTLATPVPVAHHPIDHLAEEKYWAQREGNVTAAQYQAALKQARSLPEAAQLPPSNGKSPQGITPAAYLGWTSIGPAPIASGFGGGQSAGRASSVAIDPTTSGSSTVIYLGTANGGIWKSTNNGTSWVALTDKQITTAIGAIAIDPNNHNIIYAGTGEANGSLDSYRGFGILKSTDAGNTWTLLGNSTFGNRSSAFSRITIDPRTGKIFAANNSGLFISSNGGSTWALAPGVATGKADDVQINSTANPSILVTTVRYHGMWRSTDGGSTWSQVSSGVFPAGSSWYRSAVAVAPSVQSTMYLLVSNSGYHVYGGGYNGGFYSTDSGATWDHMQSLNTDMNEGNAETWYAIDLAVDPLNSTLVYAGSLNLYYTPNAQAGGGNWVQSSEWFDTNSAHADQHGIAFASGCSNSPCGAYFANDGGLYYSAAPNTNLHSFTSLNNAPLAITEFIGGDLGTNFRTTPLALGGTQDNGGELYSGNTRWSENVGGDGGWSQIDRSNTQYMYTEYVYAAVEQSTDGGASFFDATSGLPANGDNADLNSPGALFYSPLVLDRSDDNHLAVGANYAIYETQTAKSSISWYQGSQSFLTYVSAIGISPHNSAIIYAGLNNGEIFRTTTGNSGGQSTYTQVTSPSGGGYISSIKFDPNDSTSQTIIVTTGQTNYNAGGIYKTINGGSSWTNMTGALPAYPIDASLVYYSGSTRVIVAGTDYGVYFTTNDGTTWTGLNMGLPNVAITDLSIDQAQTTISAWTHGRSVWTIAVPTLGAAAIDSIGINRPSTESDYLRLHNTTGFADFVVNFNPGTNLAPVVGDWNGSGYDTIGALNQGIAQFTLCNANSTAACSNGTNLTQFTLGSPGDTPLSGRWINSATQDGAGVYRPSNGVLYLKNALTTGFADEAMIMGLPGDAGVAGDWTGKGFDSPGIYRPSVTGFFLSNQVTNGAVYADITLTYGTSTDLPIAGDWIGQGHDGIGMFRPSNGFVYLRNSLTTGFADNSFFYGTAGDLPVAGHWQAIYPPIAPPTSPVPVLIQKTAIPPQGNGIAPGGNQIGG